LFTFLLDLDGGYAGTTELGEKKARLLEEWKGVPSRKGRQKLSKPYIEKGHQFLCDIVSELRKLAEDGMLSVAELANLRAEFRFLSDAPEQGIEKFILMNALFLSHLRNEVTNNLEEKFWDREYSLSGVISIWKTFCPEAMGQQIVIGKKKEMISQLVKNRVPLIYCSDMQAYAAFTGSPMTFLGSNNRCALNFLMTYVISTKKECERALSEHLANRHPELAVSGNETTEISETEEEEVVTASIINTNRLCSHAPCIRLVPALHNQCQYRGCTEVSCMICSNAILFDLINREVSERNEQRNYFDLCEVLNNKLGYAWFRLCYQHSQLEVWVQSFWTWNLVKLEEISAYQHKQNSEEEKQKWDEPPCNSVLRSLAILDQIHGADSLLFRKDTSLTELRASLNKSSYASTLLNPGVSKKVVALRQAFPKEEAKPGVPEAVRKWQNTINELYDEYPNSQRLTTLNRTQWGEVASLNGKLLQILGFHRPGQEDLSGTKVVSVRLHDEESGSVHLDYKGFCPDYILGLVLEGSYNLAFLMNPLDVLLGKPPKYHIVELDVGQCYLIAGPWLDFIPHIPIPKEGAESLSRKVLLLGGMFVSPSDSQIGRVLTLEHAELLKLKRWYHYERSNNGSKRLLYRVPLDAIKGSEAARAIYNTDLHTKVSSCHDVTTNSLL